MKSLPELSTFQDELEIFVQKPDDDELGFMVNKHFYTPLIPGDSRKVVSYMDNDGTSNAKAAFDEHVEKIDFAFSKNDINSAVEHAGRALHFLQDVAQPQHTEFGTFIDKTIDVAAHVDFEEQVEKNMDLLANANDENRNANSVFKMKTAKNTEELFDNTVKFSMASDKIVRKNSSSWNNIAERQYNLAVNTTKQFLAFFNEKLKKQKIDVFSAPPFDNPFQDNQII